MALSGYDAANKDPSTTGCWNQSSLNTKPFIRYFKLTDFLLCCLKFSVWFHVVA